MGNCIYCKKPAGFLRSTHQECKSAHDARQLEIERIRIEHENSIKDAENSITSTTESALIKCEALEDIEKMVAEIETSTNIPIESKIRALCRAWSNAAGHFLDDGILDKDEEALLSKFIAHFSLPDSELNVNGALTKTAQAATLRDVLNGITPNRFSFNGPLPVNLQKNETLIWAFAGCRYLEDKTRRQYVGGSQGVSVRVMKGVYYRTSAFKGEAIESTERVHIDTGWVVITNKHIYFAGSQKSVRIPYVKIVSIQPFSDGFGIIRDAASAKPQLFITHEGWFSYNLVSNATNL